jgi:hypothetical protein
MFFFLLSLSLSPKKRKNLNFRFLLTACYNGMYTQISNEKKKKDILLLFLILSSLKRFVYALVEIEIKI